MTIRRMILSGLLAILLLPVTAWSQQMTVRWDAMHFYGSPGLRFDDQPAGSVLAGLGVVSSSVLPPWFPDTADPTKEYTVVLTGMVSEGTQVTGAPGARRYTTRYWGGVFQVYEDTTPDHDFGVDPPNATAPATFTDGTLLFQTIPDWFTLEADELAPLAGTLDYGSIFDTNAGTFGSGLAFCGGWFDGPLTWEPAALLPGYVFRHAGALLIECGSPVEATSWGRLKAGYR